MLSQCPAAAGGVLAAKLVAIMESLEERRDANILDYVLETNKGLCRSTPHRPRVGEKEARKE